jgi:iron complex transport system permease protein
MSRLPARPVFICLVAGLVLSALVALHVGASTINLSEIWNNDTHSNIVFWQLRLPRILLAAVCGALLAISGTASQGLFRNPLADPSLIGVTAGASLGGALIIFVFLQFSLKLQAFSLVGITAIGAIAGGALGVGLVYSLARRVGGTSVSTMLLAGIALTAFASSLNSLLEFFSDDLTLRRLSLWRMGNLDAANYSKVGLAAITLCGLALFFQSKANVLNVFLLGEAEARHLGIAVEKNKQLFIIAIAIAVGICVALTGAIAFIGLIVPHALRMLIGPNHRLLLPASALGGALLLVIADTIARTALAPSELPTGLITALAGAPFFIFILRKRFVPGVGL